MENEVQAVADNDAGGHLSEMRVCGSRNAHPRLLDHNHERRVMTEVSNVTDRVLQTVILVAMTAVDPFRH